MVSGDVDWTFDAWNATAKALQNATLTRKLFMHRADGSIFEDKKWAGISPELWYNFSSAVAVEWWIEHGPIAAAMNNKDIDGVFLGGANADDEFFALFPTDAELRRYQDGQRKALASAVSTWRAKRPTKWLAGYASSRERGSSTLGFAADFYCPLASCVGPTQLQLHPAAAAAATVVTTTYYLWHLQRDLA
jgi:hypothetical protein